MNGTGHYGACSCWTLNPPLPHAGHCCLTGVDPNGPGLGWNLPCGHGEEACAKHEAHMRAATS